MKKGIDLSEFQKGINYSSLFGAGIGFAMVRAGYGWTYTDPAFEQHVNAFLDNGKPCGAYWFIYATNLEEAVRNADKCLEVISKFKGKLTLPIACDYEYDSDRYSTQQGVTQTNASRTAIIKAFCERIEQAGYFTSVYLNPDYISKVNYDELKRFDLWLAEWDVDKPSHECGMWQYTDKLDVAGMRIDADIAYKDYEGIIKSRGLNGFQKPEPAKTEQQKAPEPKPEKKTIKITVEIDGSKYSGTIEKQ